MRLSTDGRRRQDAQQLEAVQTEGSDFSGARRCVDVAMTGPETTKSRARGSGSCGRQTQRGAYGPVGRARRDASSVLRAPKHPLDALQRINSLYPLL